MSEFLYAIKASVEQVRSKQRSGTTVWQLQPMDDSVMMGYILLTSNDQVIVIDGGTVSHAMYVSFFIELLGGTVTAWYLTHPHNDHVGALATLLSRGSSLQVDRIYASFPSRDWIAALPNAKSETATLQMYDLFAHADAEITQALLGQFDTYDELGIEILGVKNPEITVDGVNNSSMLIRASDPYKSILFLGDLGVEEWNKVSLSPDLNRFSADYVQVAHHGWTDGIDDLYRLIAPSYGLWPTTKGEVNGAAGYPAAATHSEQSLLALFQQIGVKKNYFSFDQLYRID